MHDDRRVVRSQGHPAARTIPSVITAVHRVPVPAWPPGWDDAEVVDSVLVEEPPAPEPPGPAGGAYTRFGRQAEAGRYGRLVSVLA
jgi:hypothetical protein